MIVHKGKNLDNSMLNAIIDLVKKEGARKREDAAYSGRMDDGGAGRLFDILRVWQDGMANRLPKEFIPYADVALNEVDPDWKTYQKLKAKFEGV